MTTTTTNQIRVNGVSLYVEEHGTGAPILCIHGTGSSALFWGDAAPALAARGRVVLYDRRGCTRSQRPDPYVTTSVHEHADDAAALLEELHATPAAVIGRSYGGEVAVDLALRYPGLVRALALLEPAMPMLSAEATAWLEQVAAQFRATTASHGTAVAADRFYRSVLGDETWEGLPDDARQVVLDNGPAMLAELDGEWFTPDADALAGLTQPVLIVSGVDSPPAFRMVDDALARLIPGARLEVVGGGHLIDPAAPIVLDFLREVLRPPSGSPADR